MFDVSFIIICFFTGTNFLYFFNKSDEYINTRDLVIYLYLDMTESKYASELFEYSVKEIETKEGMHIQIKVSPNSSL